MKTKKSILQEFNSVGRHYKLIHMAKIGRISSNNYDELSPEERALLVSRKYGKYVSFFVKRMKEVKPNFQFRYLEENIKTLTIKDRLFLFNYFAQYQNFENRILLSYKHKFTSIYHELMHMASYYKSNVGIHMAGFRQTKIFTLDIGEGLNEGYTELLTRRYFFDQGIDYTYSTAVYFAKDIENIVGKDRMEKLYFSADLYNLKEDIVNDASLEDFMQFLSDMDWVIDDSIKSYKKELPMRIQRMGNFVYFTYLKRQKRFLEEGKISFQEYNFRVNETLSAIDGTYFDYKDFAIFKCDREKMQEDLKKIGINFSASLENNFVEEKEKCFIKQ